MKTNLVIALIIIITLFIILATSFVFAGNYSELYTYETYTNHTIGFYLAIVAVMTFVLIGFERQWRFKGKETEEE